MSAAASLKPLNPDERARVEATIAAVKEKVPDLPDFMKSLRSVGIEVAWRNVVYVGPPRPDAPGTVSTKNMVLETAEKLKERMRKNGSL